MKRCPISVVALLLVFGCATPEDVAPESGSGTPSTGPASTSDSGTALAGTVTTLDEDTTPISDTTSNADLGIGGACSVSQQDCPPGAKCMPWASEGGSTPDAMGCFPIHDDPVSVDEPCMVEEGPWSGMDDCDAGLLCWLEVPDTLMGTCIPLCGGIEGDGLCDDLDRICLFTNDPWGFCFATCSPVQPNCPVGETCQPVWGDAWGCIDDESGDQGAQGDPCDGLGRCDPGLTCVLAEYVPNCTGTTACCSEICDLSDPAGDAQCTDAPLGQVCLAWYEEGAAPPGLETVGVCALPP